MQPEEIERELQEACPASEEGASAKQQLLDVMYSSKRGVATSANQRAQVEELTVALEAVNPTPVATQVRHGTRQSCQDVCTSVLISRLRHREHTSRACEGMRCVLG